MHQPATAPVYPPSRPDTYPSGELPVSGLTGSRANLDRTDALPRSKNGRTPWPCMTKLFDSPYSPLRLESREPKSSHYPRLRTAQSQERREEPSIPDTPPIYRELRIKSGEELCDLLDRIKKPRWEIKARFIAHTKLYLLARRYLVTDLEEICLARIWEELHPNLHREEVFEALIQMAKIAYGSKTEGEDEELFELQHRLSLACADNLDWLEGDDQRVMRRVNKFNGIKAFAEDVHQQMEDCYDGDGLVERLMLSCRSI